jgi:hypothetical protein
LLFAGVTFDAPLDHPWAIELTDGARCVLGQGAHSRVRLRREWLAVDYHCERDDLVLLRNVRRGRVWRVGAARLVSLDAGYKLLGDRTIHRAFFGGLPPTMQRQHDLAHGAVTAARRLIHRKAPGVNLKVGWARMSLPDARWAYVIFTWNGVGRFAVLHRVQGRWVDASAFKPYCRRLPGRVRTQLFLDHKTHNPGALMPPGELRC